MSILKKSYFIVFIVLSIIISGCENSNNNNSSTSIKVDAYNVDDYVTLGEYKGIEVEVPKLSTPTDQEVENEINTRLQADTKYEIITDRSVTQKGDYVLINTVGRKDGEVFEGRLDDYEYYEVGSGGYIDEIENALVGKQPGLPFSITVEFPKDYFISDLAGQKVVYTVIIKSINKKVVPVLNDEYVRSKSTSSKTVAEYKEEVRKDLQEGNKTLLNMVIQQYIEQVITKNATVSGFPNGLIEKMTAEFKANLSYMAQSENMSLKEYIKDTYDWDESNYEDKLKERVEADTKKALILEAIEKKENLTMTKEESDKAITEFAKENGYASKEALFKDIDEDVVKRTFQQRKVMDWLIDNAKLVEKENTTS